MYPFISDIKALSNSSIPRPRKFVRAPSRTRHVACWSLRFVVYLALLILGFPMLPRIGLDRGCFVLLPRLVSRFPMFSAFFTLSISFVGAAFTFSRTYSPNSPWRSFVACVFPRYLIVPSRFHYVRANPLVLVDSVYGAFVHVRSPSLCSRGAIGEFLLCDGKPFLRKKDAVLCCCVLCFLPDYIIEGRV